jgi:hypothetical protein
LAERLIENRIAGVVDEIGKDDGVLVGKFWCAMKLEITRGSSRQ